MEERIKYLFRQYLENTCSRKEFEEFFSLIREAAHNAEVRELIRKAYEETGKNPSSLTYVDEGGNLVLTEPDWMATTLPEQEHKPRRRRQFISIAAACILIMVGIFWITERLGQNSEGSHHSYTKKSTQRSEYKYLLLPDSTQVWLNAASTLEYPKYTSNNKREVFLIGEAYFDVKHSDKTPFVIHTGVVTTVVMGTAFNIKAYPDRETFIISVSRGKVRVEHNNKPVAFLTEGQQVRVSAADSMTVMEKKTAISEPTSWQQGNLVYDDEQLGNVLSDLERIYDVKIKVHTDSLRQVNISTSFKREIGIEQALMVLCKLTDTELKLQNGSFVIQ
jgi:transmembrane sensor